MRETQESATRAFNAGAGNRPRSVLRLAIDINQAVADMLRCQEAMPGSTHGARAAARAAMLAAVLASDLEMRLNLEPAPIPGQTTPLILGMLDVHFLAGRLIALADRRDDYEIAQTIPMLMTRLQTVCLRLGTQLGRQIDQLLEPVETGTAENPAPASGAGAS